MGEELVSQQAILTDGEIERLWRVATALAKSGMFKGVTQGEQAFAKIIIGRDFGLSAAQSMTGIHIVQGNPQLHYAMIGSFVRNHGYDFRVTEHTDEACTIQFLGRDGEELGNSRFTRSDAEKAGLWGKDIWKKSPKNMLYARAMSNGAKWYTPDALGGIPVYVEGEIPDPSAVKDGAPVDATAVEVPDYIAADTGYLGEPQETPPAHQPATVVVTADPESERNRIRYEIQEVDRKIGQAQVEDDQDGLAGLVLERDLLVEQMNAVDA